MDTIDKNVGDKKNNINGSRFVYSKKFTLILFLVTVLVGLLIGVIYSQKIRKTPASYSQQMDKAHTSGFEPKRSPSPTITIEVVSQLTFNNFLKRSFDPREPFVERGTPETTFDYPQELKDARDDELLAFDCVAIDRGSRFNQEPRPRWYTYTEQKKRVITDPIIDEYNERSSRILTPPDPYREYGTLINICKIENGDTLLFSTMFPSSLAEQKDEQRQVLDNWIRSFFTTSVIRVDTNGTYEYLGNIPIDFSGYEMWFCYREPLIIKRNLDMYFSCGAGDAFSSIQSIEKISFQGGVPKSENIFSKACGAEEPYDNSDNPKIVCE